MGDNALKTRTTPLLQVSQVSRLFGNFAAIEEANLEVPAGSITAVIGPNGAGKTTLFNVIAGHLAPSGGRIRFDGRDVTGTKPHQLCRLGMARAFQLSSVFTNLTARENVQTAIFARQRMTNHLWTTAAPLGVEEALDLLNTVGLGDQADRPVHELAYGDRRLLEIAMALASKPNLLMLDEPAAGLSMDSIQQVMDLIRRLHQQGLTVVFTEHHMDVVFGLAGRVMVMHQGQTIAQGAPAEVRASEEVQRAYLGTSTGGDRKE